MSRNWTATAERVTTKRSGGKHCPTLIQRSSLPPEGKTGTASPVRLAVSYAVSDGVIDQRRNARLRHGARSHSHLAPAIVSMKRSLLARMGLRQRELTWSGRELFDVYCCSKANVTAIHQWLEINPMIDEGRWTRSSSSISMGSAGHRSTSGQRCAGWSAPSWRARLRSRPSRA
jgi:hypothetical protein